jgi:hypothetical protein
MESKAIGRGEATNPEKVGQRLGLGVLTQTTKSA